MYGGLVNKAPEMGVIQDGPWKGKWNGDHKYQVDMSEQLIPMGSNHIIGDVKVKVVHQDTIAAWGQCHQPASDCPGRGLAKQCYQNGGAWVSLIGHLRGRYSKCWGFRYGRGES